MTQEQPERSPSTELESRIIAAILGEASDFEIAQIEETLGGDRTSPAFRDAMQRIHRLFVSASALDLLGKFSAEERSDSETSGNGLDYSKRIASRIAVLQRIEAMSGIAASSSNLRLNHERRQEILQLLDEEGEEGSVQVKRARPTQVFKGFQDKIRFLIVEVHKASSLLFKDRFAGVNPKRVAALSACACLLFLGIFLPNMFRSSFPSSDSRVMSFRSSNRLFELPTGMLDATAAPSPAAAPTDGMESMEMEMEGMNMDMDMDFESPEGESPYASEPNAVSPRFSDNSGIAASDSKELWYSGGNGDLPPSAVKKDSRSRLRGLDRQSSRDETELALSDQDSLDHGFFAGGTGGRPLLSNESRAATDGVAFNEGRSSGGETRGSGESDAGIARGFGGAMGGGGGGMGGGGMGGGVNIGGFIDGVDSSVLPADKAAAPQQAPSSRLSVSAENAPASAPRSDSLPQTPTSTEQGLPAAPSAPAADRGRATRQIGSATAKRRLLKESESLKRGESQSIAEEAGLDLNGDGLGSFADKESDENDESNEIDSTRKSLELRYKSQEADQNDDQLQSAMIDALEIQKQKRVQPKLGDSALEDRLGKANQALEEAEELSESKQSVREFSTEKKEKISSTVSRNATAQQMNQQQLFKAMVPTAMDTKQLEEAFREVKADQAPFSTFSLHVSDVSYKLAKAALERGQWPDPNRIRIEEFVNAIDYGDPIPSQSERVACRIEQAIHPFLQQRNLLRVAMRTAATGRSNGTPLRLTFLLDNSGSMERIDRRQTVRRAFQVLAEQLHEGDEVNVISFASQPRLLAERLRGKQAVAILRMLDQIPSEGGTNFESALMLAGEKAREHYLDGAQNRIVLITDGAVNLGDANPLSLSNQILSLRESGIAFDAAGIGADGLNDEVLEALTRKGDGRYYVLDSTESVDDGFAKQIAGALRPAAKNVKIQVEFNPRRVGMYKLLGFEKHRLKTEDFRDDQVDAAELAAAEAGVAVYQIQVKPDGFGDVGSVSVRFQDLKSGRMIEERWPIRFDGNTQRIEDATESMKLAGASTLFAMKLKGDQRSDTVDLSYLRSVLTTLSAGQLEDPRVAGLRQMIDQASQMLSGSENP